jgi:hypothetical protein
MLGCCCEQIVIGLQGKVIEFLPVKKRNDSFSAWHRMAARFSARSIGFCEEVYRD